MPKTAIVLSTTHATSAGMAAHLAASSLFTRPTVPFIALRKDETQGQGYSRSESKYPEYKAWKANRGR